MFVPPLTIVKNRTTDPKWSHFAKTRISKVRLHNYRFSLSHQWNLKPGNQELPDHQAISKVICLTDLCHPLKKGDLARTNLLFASVIFLSHSLLPVNLSFHITSPTSFLTARWDATQFMYH